MNYGLRWEPYFPITDLNDREVQFSQADYLKGTKSTRYVNAPIGLYYPGDSPNGRTIPNGGADASKKQFAPRIGLAWDVTGDGKTSVRAGYGLFYDTAEMYLLQQHEPAGAVQLHRGLSERPLRQAVSGTRKPERVSVFRRFPDQLAVPDRRSRRWSCSPPGSSRTHKTGIPRWSAASDRGSRPASYVGTKATHLVGNADLNAPDLRFHPVVEDEPGNHQRKAAAAAVPGHHDHLYRAELDLQRHAAFRSRSVSRAASPCSANYTFSRAIDELSKNAQVTSVNVQNPFNWRMARGPVGQRPHQRVHRLFRLEPARSRRRSEARTGWPRRLGTGSGAGFSRRRRGRRSASTAPTMRWPAPARHSPWRPGI